MNATESARELRHLLPPDLSTLPIYCHATIDSTNAEGKRIPLPDGVDAALIVADTQTAGRGRMDRSFYSPAGTGLYMTLAYRTSGATAPLDGLTPAVAVAAARSIQSLTGITVAIKWVNDLYVNNRKVGGILVERCPDGDATRLIIGIGINLTTTSFPDGLRAPAGALSDETANVPSPAALATAITANLLEILPSGLQNGFSSVLSDYRDLSLLQKGCPINVYRGTSDIPTPATVLGVADDFSLLVHFPDGKTAALSDGEVSVRM